MKKIILLLIAISCLPLLAQEPSDGSDLSVRKFNAIKVRDTVWTNQIVSTTGAENKVIQTEFLQGYFEGDLTDSLPTVDEIYTVTGFYPDDVPAGYPLFIKDTNGDTATYIVTSTGIAWYTYQMRFVGDETPPEPPVNPSTPSTIPMTHTQYYVTHPHVQNGDYVGYVHVNCTDTCFTDHSSYTWSIISGNTGTGFAVGSSTGLLTINSASAVTSNGDYTLGVQIEDTGGDKDTATCYIDYLTGTEGSVLMYIDPSIGGSSGSGTYASPWSDFSHVNSVGEVDGGDAVFIKRGTRGYPVQLNFAYNLGGARTYFAAYGQGAKPILEETGGELSHIFYVGANTEETRFDSLTLMDLKLTAENRPFDEEQYAIFKHSYSKGFQAHRLEVDSISNENGAIYMRGREFEDMKIKIYDCLVQKQYDRGRALKHEACGSDITNFTAIDAAPTGILVGTKRVDFGTLRYIYLDAVEGYSSFTNSALQLRAQGSLTEWFVSKNYYNAAYIQGGQGEAGADANPINITVKNGIVMGATNALSFYNLSSTPEPDEIMDNILFENFYIDQPVNAGIWCDVYNSGHRLGDITFNKVIVNRSTGTGLYIDHTEAWEGTLEINNCVLLGSSTADVYVSGSMDDAHLENTVYDVTTGLSYLSTATNYDFGTADPFVDTEGGDFTPDATEGAGRIINLGTSQTFDTDILGNDIGTIDIGSIEYGGTNYNWTERSGGVGSPPPSGEPDYTDNFDAYSYGDLDGNGNWVAVTTGIIYVQDQGGDKIVKPQGGTGRAWYYFNQSLANDQYAEVVCDQIVEYRDIGIGVRGSTSQGTYYTWYSDDTDAYLSYYNNGSENVLATGDPWTAGHTYRLSVTGNVLTCTIDGDADTSIDGDGSYTDSSLSSGYAGLVMYGNGASWADDFGCGEN